MLEKRIKRMTTWFSDRGVKCARERKNNYGNATK